MESNTVNRAQPDPRPLNASQPVGVEPSHPVQSVPRPPLIRTDSRSSFPQQQLRPAGPPQPRPQFQPGGPVSNPSQFVPRPGTPQPRAPVPPGTPGSQQIRNQPPLQRPAGPQSVAPQFSPRPLQPPNAGLPPQRVVPPNNLQFGPRQPPQFGSASTPDGSRPQTPQQPNAPPKNSAQQIAGQISRQPSQGSLRGPDQSNSYQNKPINLDHPSVPFDNKNEAKQENGIEMPGAAKGRSYSIAAAPGSPSPFRMEDDRRKSVSALGSKIDDLTSRSPGLGLIREGIDSKDNVRSSKESIKSEISDGTRDNIPERPESRISDSKMTESFIGSLPVQTPKKKSDDDDDVILQNNLVKKLDDSPQTKGELLDRSPSLTRSDESPEPRPKSTLSPALSNKSHSQSATPEPARPKTPKTEIKPEIIADTNKEFKITKEPIKTPSKSPILDSKPPMPVNKKPNELHTSVTPELKARKAVSAPKMRQKDGDNDSGVDESTQGNDLNGSPGSPTKKTASKLPTKEKSNNSLKTSLSRSSSKSATAKTPENPPSEKKKVPMNKVQVGSAPSPNIKAVKSKIGSLENSTYKPGGGKVKIENRKLDFNKVTPKIAAKNDAYTPSGGTKKITSAKLEWNVKSKVGSLQNAAYKPGGGDKKIETVKLDFKEKAKPKVASTVNITHKPGGGAVKIENQKLEFKAQSKVGSLDNVKHKPGGGDIKIFDDKDYIKQTGGMSPVPGSHSQREEHYYMPMHEWSEEDRPVSRCRSARAPRTPRTPRALSPRKAAPYEDEDQLIQRNNERNRRASIRPISARDPPRSACNRSGSITQRPAFRAY